MRLVVRRISKEHDRGAFDCGKEPLTRWFRKSAGQADRKGHTRTWVIIDADEPREEGQPFTVIGYFSLCPSRVDFASVPAELRKHFPEFPVPTILLARLALDQRYRGKGLGSHILIEAFRKALEAHETVAGPILEVDALDEEARAYYEHFGFQPSMSEVEPMKLFLSMEKARVAVQASDEAAERLKESNT